MLRNDKYKTFIKNFYKKETNVCENHKVYLSLRNT